MRDLVDIAWLAGLIEGEGSFIWGKTTPTISVQMSDKDVLERAAKLMGVEVRGPRFPKGKPTYKPIWAIYLAGPQAVGWMLTLYSFMGERRRAKIEDNLAKWKAQPGFPKASRGRRLKALCHPDRNRVSRGKCKECYMADWRKRDAEARRMIEEKQGWPTNQQKLF